ncbi:MAG: hypothetical protein AMDU5_GPLC00004G0371 [Thermoplasmatales archaeon Gpl]|nr:MAG: hypothetical protein AMDU5_GPLC00004G0371 [Thermoplasmatales archaeon Gpl]
MTGILKAIHSTINGRATEQKKDLKVEYEAKHKYEESGEYQIMVKVVDVFGNDTNKILKVKI